MNKYGYKITNEKETVEGSVNATGYEDAASQIKREGWYILELKEKKADLLTRLITPKQKFSSFERINFTDHLGSMISAGTPIRDALDAYSDARDTKNDITESITKDIEQGRTLSQALEKYPETFPPLYISLVRAGESTGSLDETLEYLGNELRRDYEFVQKVKSSLYYPILVLALSLVVIAMVVTVVLPKVVEVSKTLGGEMPALTRIIVGIADFVSNYGIFILLTFAAIPFIFYRLYKNPKTSAKLSKKILASPLIGNVMKQYILARFFRILGSSVKYGVPIVESLGSALAVVQNEEYKESLKRVKAKVTKGASIAESIAFEPKELFPGLIVRTLKGAEKTGALDKASLRLSLSYELAVDRDLKRLTTMIEPAMVIFLGVVIALIAISVITPIYQMTSRIQ